tara:strand:- start:270 stop:626 length:357 start_codon:yes stop_codon:yes gene_type:complete
MRHIENPDVLCDNPFEGSVDIEFSDFLKIEFNDTAILTFLIYHEIWGYFQVSADYDELHGFEDVPYNNIDLAKWYEDDIQGTPCEWDLRDLDENPRIGIKVNHLCNDYDQAIKWVDLS